MRLIDVHTHIGRLLHDRTPLTPDELVSWMDARHIEQAVVIGDKRKFCTAVIVPAYEAVKNWAKEQGKDINSYGDMLKLEGLRELIRQEIDKVNEGLARYETIKNFIIAREPFSIESGELTPSLKTKRRVIEQKYKEEIDKMYQV